MKKLILKWLFGTDEIDSYMELLRKNIDHLIDDIGHTNECLELIREHKETIKRAEWFIKLSEKLLIICENHGIDIDEEIKNINIEEVNANEMDKK